MKNCTGLCHQGDWCEPERCYCHDKCTDSKCENVAIHKGEWIEQGEYDQHDCKLSQDSACLGCELYAKQWAWRIPTTTLMRERLALIQ